MAFPVVAARTAGEVNTNQASHSIALGSPNAGDLLIAVVGFDGIPDVVVNTAASGFGWHRFGPAEAPSSAARSSVFWKVAAGGGTDVLTLTILGQTLEKSRSVCYRITGHANAVYASSAVASSTNGDPPNQAITGSAQDVLFIAALVIDAQVVASGAPSSYGSLNTYAATASDGVSISTAERDLNATSDNPGTFTNTTEQWIAWTIAVPSTTITTHTRASQVVPEALSTSTPKMRASQVVAEMLSSNALKLYASQVVAEVLSTNVPDDVGGGDQLTQLITAT